MPISNFKCHIVLGLALALLCAGCARRKYTQVSSTAEPPRAAQPRKSPPPASTDQAARETGVSDTIALVGGRPMRFSQLRPLLIETSGGDVLSELVLDEQIARELENRKLTVTEADAQRERELMLSQFSADPDHSRRLLEQLRERLGLGPLRFERFLQRNAALRKLVAGEAKVTDAMVRLAYEQRTTPQSVCRMILVPSLREATEVLRRLEAGEPFIDLAIARSQDESRIQGGLLPPIAPYDTSFPSAITATAGKLDPGQTSDPIALDTGFAILKCEKKITPETASYERIAPDLRKGLQLAIERNLMDRQARLLLRQADVTVLDAALDREYKARRKMAVEPAN